ncbi:hypothetical protein [Shewanella mangrovisoli]|uniref:hypothetical protein n=1 Tax=Shewanella mangrovisoli TaxID=2864211 RepID=UPI0035BA5272
MLGLRSLRSLILAKPFAPISKALTSKASMKRIISKNISIEEFKKRFSEIRETFLDSLTAASDGYKNVRYLACDEDGAAIKWV